MGHTHCFSYVLFPSFLSSFGLPAYVRIRSIDSIGREREREREIVSVRQATVLIHYLVSFIPVQSYLFLQRGAILCPSVLQRNVMDLGRMPCWQQVYMHGCSISCSCMTVFLDFIQGHKHTMPSCLPFMFCPPPGSFSPSHASACSLGLLLFPCFFPVHSLATS